MNKFRTDYLPLFCVLNHSLICSQNNPILTLRSTLFCQVKHHIVQSRDAFLHFVGAQAHSGVQRQ